MYINFWYPVCTSEELTSDEPRQVMLLGLNFVAFRDSSGAAHVLSDTCIHRGGSLSNGKVVGDNVACPYHGWQFGGDGQCRKIPSEGDAKPPKRAKVDAYPTEERYGIVFAFLGDLPEDERPEIYNIEQFGAEGWRANKLVILNVDCYYERSVENGLDPVHNEFVHPSQGFPPMHKETFRTWETPWGGGFEADFGDPDLEKTELAKTRNVTGELRAGSWHHGPNVLVTSIFVNAASNFVQVFFEAPIDGNRTRIYFVNMRNFILDPEMDDKVIEINTRIAHEDIAVLENLYPRRTPDNLTKELMTSSDEIIVKYRNWLSKFESNGWKIDQKALRQDEGDIAYAIPSPARRESKGWVLDTVPLVPTK